MQSVVMLIDFYIETTCVQICCKIMDKPPAKNSVAKKSWTTTALCKSVEKSHWAPNPPITQ
jgi:hypothetical protein